LQRFASAVRTGFQPPRSGDEILGSFGAVELAEQQAALVVVARITADGRKRVRRKRHEVRQGKAPRNILRVRIQSPILVDDDNAGQFRRVLVA